MNHMAKVVIAWDYEDPSRQGKTVDLDDEEARVAVQDGRARYADDKEHPANATKGK